MKIVQSFCSTNKRNMMAIRCYTCNKVVANLLERYSQLVEMYTEQGFKEKSTAMALDALGIKRYCCRRMFISYNPILDDVARIR